MFHWIILRGSWFYFSWVYLLQSIQNANIYQSFAEYQLAIFDLSYFLEHFKWRSPSVNCSIENKNDRTPSIRNQEKKLKKICYFRFKIIIVFFLTYLSEETSQLHFICGVSWWSRIFNCCLWTFWTILSELNLSVILGNFSHV